VTGPLAGRPLAILGFGNQGEAQALNLRDEGADLLVGVRPGGSSEGRARAHGFRTLAPAEALRQAQVAAVLLPDEIVPEIWPTLSKAWSPGVALVFAHGFNLLYSDLALPEEGDVVVVSPTGPGQVLRQRYVAGQGLPAYLAVHQDRSGGAWELAEAYATALGCARARLWRTTVAEETEVDLFGEQVVLCGGMNALVTAAFETLVERGYTPEVAYLECVHQLKFLADLLHERGVAGMRRGISGTALFGDLTRGPRVIGQASRSEMARILEEIRSGEFARAWKAEVKGQRRLVRERLEQADRHAIEEARRSALGEAPSIPSKAPRESRKTLSKN
jgi:ketol-acid reductoisomerase